MKKKLLIISTLVATLIGATIITIASLDRQTKAENQLDAHPFGESNVVIDYVEMEDEEYVEREFDDSTKYDYSSLDFDPKHGSYVTKSGSIITSEVNTLLVNNDVPFPYGTFSCDVTGTSNATDDGIVFGVKDSNKSSYWEDKNIYYYFFFLGHDGYLSLGKVMNQTWSSVYSASVGSFSQSTTYNLKVIVKSNLILLYLNDTLTFHFTDANFIEGTKFGLRSGAANVKYANIHLTNDYEYGD